ncbi:hypothetical protein FF124_15130 [Martelella lutilitoris]|uniref:Lipoprotein n=1 Tax=Martelella lutilitoris TaxID=2583532 RepID=A0A5C4JQE8_9HYPH|nr:hypothetical protein [Martelella lutilitoris]TNB46889.1 hypothetical protein FF124_15130 [Martelella lutilitoris]
MSKLKMLLCVAPLVLLAACTEALDYDAEDDAYTTGANTPSTNASAKSSFLQCPMSCTTKKGGKVNVQVASTCDAARSYYNAYKRAVNKYGASGAEPHWDAYEQTAELANEMYVSFGCAPDY